MTNSLLIGETLTNLLLSDDNLSPLIGNRIYPLVAPEGTNFPFIIYKRESLRSNGCKDGYYEDTVQFSITIVCTRYAESVEIAQKVRKTLERSNIADMYDVHITSATEEYVEDSYVQTLNFITEIQ